MKKVLLILLCAIAHHATIAQTSITISASSLTCAPDIRVRLYALDASWNVVGMSNPFQPNNIAPTSYNYSSISMGPGWALDPGTPVCSTNEWEFGRADVYNCVGVASSGSTCFSGNYDMLL